MPEWGVSMIRNGGAVSSGICINGIYLEKAKKYRRFSPQNAVGNYAVNST